MARDYLSLIERYLLSDITADEFQDAYWPMRRAWLGRDVWLTGDHGKVIDSFDTDMDAFSSDPDVAWHEIDEAELRRCATCARDALRTYVEGLNAAPPT